MTDPRIQTIRETIAIAEEHHIYRGGKPWHAERVALDSLEAEITRDERATPGDQQIIDTVRAVEANYTEALMVATGANMARCAEAVEDAYADLSERLGSLRAELADCQKGYVARGQRMSADLARVVIAEARLKNATELQEYVIRAWERLGECEDEFGCQSASCGEYSEDLDSAIVALAALAADPHTEPTT